MGIKQRFVITLPLLVATAATLLIPETFADPPRRSSSSYGNSSASNSTRSTIGRRASPQITRQTPSIPRSILSPTGSTTNVRPGFYQQLNAPPAQQGGSGLGVPYVVYVPTAPTYPSYTAPYQVAPPSTHTVQNVPTTPPLNQDPQPAPQPVYVVNPPSETRSPQPVYIVNPNPGGTPSAGVPAVQPPAQQAAKPSPPPQPKAPRKPVAVEYRIAPADAKVYLDDELLGTGNDLVESLDELMLEPGVHVLEVTHPDYRPQRVVFGVGSNEPVKVAVDLTTERIGRRSRVR